MRHALILHGLLVTTMWLAPVPSFGNGGRPVTASLSGGDAIPSGDPDGSGEAFVTANFGQREVCFQLSVSDIASATLAHIHKAPYGQNGPVVVALIPPSSGFSSGCVNGVSQDLILDLLRTPDDFYINVHNTDYPAGAVRGQLQNPNF